MSAHSPSSYALSLTVHGAAIALLLGVAWVFQSQAPKPVDIFELVAGVGDNYTATVAPALGTPTGTELKVPAVSIPAPMTLPKIEEPAPTPPVPVPLPEPPKPIPQAEPVPPKAAPVKETTPTASAKPAILDTKRTTFQQDVKRLADKREKRKVDQFRKEQEAKAKREAAEAAKRMTEEEFRKKYGAQAGAKGGTPKVAKVDGKGIANGVVGGSTANMQGGAGGTALSRQESSQMDAYFSLLLQLLQKAHVPPPGAGDRLVAGVSCHIAVDGTISDVRIARSSGNPEFDQSALDAFRKVVLPIRPDGRSDTVTMNFKAQER